jgi:exodeoxyribonuclease VII large subunit
VDCRRARGEQAAAAARLADHGRRAVLVRARTLAALSRVPSDHLGRQRARLHQQLREIRAGSRRRLESERSLTERRAIVLARKTAASLLDCRERRARELQRLALALAGHHPQRTLERGYVLVQSREGEPIVTAAGAREKDDVQLRFADGELGARILER